MTTPDLAQAASKFRVIVEKLIESVDNVDAIADGSQQQPSFDVRKHPTCRSDSDNEMDRSTASVCQGCAKIPVDWNSARFTAQDFAGILPLLCTVDDREDFVIFRMPSQAIGCLSVNLAEVAFTINDRGFGSKLVTVGRWLCCLADGFRNGKRAKETWR